MNMRFCKGRRREGGKEVGREGGREGGREEGKGERREGRRKKVKRNAGRHHAATPTNDTAYSPTGATAHTTG